MTFEHWWATLTTREQAQRTKEDIDEAWQAAFREGYEKGVAAFQVAVQIEREACAALCFEYTPHSFEGAETTAYELGVAIRERSNVKVSGPEAALSPEGRARLPGCATGGKGEER